MKSIWMANYDGNEIKVENTWVSGERLYINDALQDETYSLASTKLLGHLFNKNGEKLIVKANIGGLVKITCNVFVDDRKVELVQQK